MSSSSVLSAVRTYGEKSGPSFWTRWSRVVVRWCTMSVMASMMELVSVSREVKLSSNMLSWWRLAEWSTGGGFVCGGGVTLSVFGPCKSSFSLVWSGGGRFDVMLRESWIVALVIHDLLFFLVDAVGVVQWHW